MNPISGKTYLWSPPDGPKEEVQFLERLPDNMSWDGPNPNQTENPSESPGGATTVIVMCLIKVLRTGKQLPVPVDELFELSDA